jgi:ABC-2 type transport system permease protein
VTQFVAIATRELSSYFRTPVGWVVTALYVTLSSIVFAFMVLGPAEPASLRPFFGLSGWLLMFLAPAVSMRLMADEYRSGSIEALMTAPVSDWVVIAGKYIGAVAFLAIMLLPTLIYPATLEWLADPDYGPMLAGYLGLALSGMLYLAAGMLFSTLTSSQTLAFLGTLLTLLLIRLTTAEGIAQRAPVPWSDALFAISIDVRLSDFARGAISTGDAAFFIIASAWLMVLSVIALQSRRWR